jgi:hypothetical protein
MFSTSSRNSWDAAYINVKGEITNHTLTVIYRSNNKVIEGSAQTCKMLGTITTKPLSVAGTKTGYSGNSWVSSETGAAFSQNTTYIASAFSDRICDGDTTVYLDIGWSLSPTGSAQWTADGNAYLSEPDNLDLYAVWEPVTYQITLDPLIYAQEYAQAGTYTTQGVKKNYVAGTGKFYEVYEHLITTGDLYADKSAVTKSSKGSTKIATLPSKTGYDFIGYYKTLAGAVSGQAIDSGGNILIGNKDYTSDSYAYAGWNPYVVTIFFDQQEGSGGTKTAKATYDQAYPQGLTAPVRNGWSFKGYYTQPDGKGTCVYNEAMNPACRTVEHVTACPIIWTRTDCPGTSCIPWKAPTPISSKRRTWQETARHT